MSIAKFIQDIVLISSWPTTDSINKCICLGCGHGALRSRMKILSAVMKSYAPLDFLPKRDDPEELILRKDAKFAKEDASLSF